MREDTTRRKWVTVKIPEDLSRVMDKHIKTPVDGVKLFDSRTDLIRYVLHEYFGRIGAKRANKTNTHLTQEEETIRAI